jgi:hypothetical protein
MSGPKIPAAPVKGTRTADTWPTHKAKARRRNHNRATRRTTSHG